MKSISPALIKSLAVRTAVAMAAVAACSGASAATFAPSSLGVTDPTFSFDTLTVNDYAKVTFSGPTFSESGLLDISAIGLGGTTVTPSGYGTDYALYVSFTATGTAGVLQTLNYSVFGYTGPSAMFSVSDATGASKTGSAGTLLGGGTLSPSATNTYGGDGVYFAYLAANTLSFASTSGFSSASGAFASFTNDQSNLKPGTGGFLVDGGGGTIHITSAVPEPETYALMLGGLAAIGFVARRRSNS